MFVCTVSISPPGLQSFQLLTRAHPSPSNLSRIEQSEIIVTRIKCRFSNPTWNRSPYLPVPLQNYRLFLSLQFLQYHLPVGMLLISL